MFGRWSSFHEQGRACKKKSDKSQKGGGRSDRNVPGDPNVAIVSGSTEIEAETKD